MNKEPKIEVIADSISVTGNRIVTVKLTYWLNDNRQDELLTLTSEDLEYYPNQHILDVINTHTPNLVEDGAWHLPLVSEYEIDGYPHLILEISAGRCARVSSKMFDGSDATVEDAISLCCELLNEPKQTHHMSHQAWFDIDTNRWIPLRNYFEETYTFDTWINGYKRCQIP